MDILDQVVHEIVYKDYDGTQDNFEEIYRDMQHNEVLQMFYRMAQMNQMR